MLLRLKADTEETKKAYGDKPFRAMRYEGTLTDADKLFLQDLEYIENYYVSPNKELCLIFNIDSNYEIVVKNDTVFQVEVPNTSYSNGIVILNSLEGFALEEDDIELNSCVWTNPKNLKHVIGFAFFYEGFLEKGAKQLVDRINLDGVVHIEENEPDPRGRCLNIISESKGYLGDCDQGEILFAYKHPRTGLFNVKVFKSDCFEEDHNFTFDLIHGNPI